MPERLSSTLSASSAIRRRFAGRVLEVDQDVVGGQRQAVGGVQLGVERAQQRRVHAQQPAPGAKLGRRQLRVRVRRGERGHARQDSQPVVARATRARGRAVVASQPQLGKATTGRLDVPWTAGPEGGLRPMPWLRLPRAPACPSRGAVLGCRPSCRLPSRAARWPSRWPDPRRPRARARDRRPRPGDQGPAQGARRPGPREQRPAHGHDPRRRQARRRPHRPEREAAPRSRSASSASTGRRWACPPAGPRASRSSAAPSPPAGWRC